VKSQQRLSHLLNTNLVALGSEPAFSNINVAELTKLSVKPVLLGIVTVLVPSRDLILGVVVFDDVVDGLRVRALDHPAHDTDFF